MTSDREDEALSWGDDDPTLDAGTRLPAGFVAVGKGSETVSSDPAPKAPSASVAGETATSPAGAASVTDDGSAAERSAPQTSNTALITVGMFGGIFGIEAIGWIIGGLRLRASAEFLISPVAYQVSLWLAVLAPLIWFGTVLVLTRGGRTWLRVVLLVVGAILVLPWPFILVGAIG